MNWQKELRLSGMIHKPLPLHTERSLEAETADKEILKSRSLAEVATWKAGSEGGIEPCPEKAPNGEEAISMFGKAKLDRRPGGQLEEGDCGNYGPIEASMEIPGENWEAYNRISFFIRCRTKGMRKVNVRVVFRNDGKEKLPDIYGRDGVHVVNLENNGWTPVQIEMPALPRDKVTGFYIQANRSGCETPADLGNELVLDISVPSLEQVPRAERAIGWDLDDDEIAICFSGYRCAGRKIAVAKARADRSFTVIDTQGKVHHKGEGKVDPQFPGLMQLDFSAVTEPGEYRVQVGEMISPAFPVSEDIWEPSLWKTVNFIFCERCGYPVPGVHMSCHRDICAHHKGVSWLMNGGWHDAGDVSQQLVQTAEVTQALLEMAAALEPESELRVRLLEEAQWGLDYVLKSRYGDGYRATSVGMSMWTDGFMGTKDDITMRLHNNALENYMCSWVEAYAAQVLRSEDPSFADTLLSCAKADYAFAKERFAQTGFDERPPIYWEHTWMTAESLFMATISLAASELYAATGETDYAAEADKAMEYVLACQETGDCGKGFEQGGFFWRSTERKAISHFNHQAREQVYMQAIVRICETQPNSEKLSMWKRAAERYASYIKGLLGYASPYGMMPAGLYRMEERDDKESFDRQHLLTGPETYEEYANQLKQAVDLGTGYYLKQFPVWFSFRGNNAVMLTMGKAAALCGRLLGDQDLLAAAENQLQWNIGLNPFRQSLMYGEGQRYAQQYAALPGEAVGELPVGIQTRGAEDVPYWPQMNNATYKEVWLTPSGKWLGIMAEIYRNK